MIQTIIPIIGKRRGAMRRELRVMMAWIAVALCGLSAPTWANDSRPQRLPALPQVTATPLPARLPPIWDVDQPLSELTGPLISGHALDAAEILPHPDNSRHSGAYGGAGRPSDYLAIAELPQSSDALVNFPYTDAVNLPLQVNPRESVSVLQSLPDPTYEPFSQPWHFDFSPTPMSLPPLFHDHATEQSVYDDKHPVPVQRPLLELGREFYGSGIRPPSETWLGPTNLVHQQFYVYGDYRSGIAGGRNQAGRIDNWAQRLNLDLDYRITATERFHAFVGPLNDATNFTNVSLEDERLRYNEFYNLVPVTGFFEGDLGAIMGGVNGGSSPAEIPVTAGLVPLLFQNGIWMEDAVTAVAVAIPARHSRALNWSNYDATFFAVVDQINSPAFGADEHAAQAFGTAWFIDTYGGYIETGYAYLHDRKDLGRSYHNATFSFTRRYFDRISNSVRVITNSGQDLAKGDRTADGVLLLVENSLVTSAPMNLIPYCNAFAGWDRPQSVARAGVSGGVLRNTGINFEIDGLNGHPTLDATAADSWGGAIGVDLIGNDFDRQWIIEAAYVSPHGDRALIAADQIALGTRYQFTLSHRTIIRMDAMYGWQRDDIDVYGTRLEYRWKF